MKDGLSAETLGKIIADAEAHGGACAVEEWKERNLRRVNIQGVTVYVLGIEAQAHLETINRNLTMGKLGAAKMRERAKAECERHAKFCKEEADKGGDRAHLMARFEEATYNAKRIGSLPLTPEAPT